CDIGDDPCYRRRRITGATRSCFAGAGEAVVVLGRLWAIHFWMHEQPCARGPSINPSPSIPVATKDRVPTAVGTQYATPQPRSTEPSLDRGQSRARIWTPVTHLVRARLAPLLSHLSSIDPLFDRHSPR